MKKSKFNSNNRIFFLLIIFILLSLALVARLFFVQIVKSGEYSKMALEQINSSEEIVSDRGIIFDSSGKKIAVNVNASTVYFNGKYVEDKVLTNGKTGREIIADELSPLLDENRDELFEKISTDKRIKIKQWVDVDTAKEIREKDLAGIEVIEGYKRFYPFGALAGNLIGFVNVDGVGQYGVEASYNEELSGVPGRFYKSADALNRKLPLGESETISPTDGYSLVLTMDQSIQKIVEDEAKKIFDEYSADRVNIIVEKVDTGDILAMSSYPSFDINRPTAPVNDVQRKSWEEKTDEEIQNDWYANWRNPITSDVYEPGSTFKLITASGAIEENTSNPNKQYYCTGYIRDIKNAPPIRCVSYENPHGNITLKEGLAKSCNPTFVYTSRELGKEKFLKYIKAFGFGEKTGIELPGEAKGIVFDTADEISDLNLATLSYGHSIAVTPIQLINAVNAIANDGVLMKPRIVKELTDKDGNTLKTVEIVEKRQVISKQTADTMLDMMENVVESGTASRARSSMYKIGGKTGTAAKISKDGGYEENQYISSFVGVAPIENPQITVLVVVDNPKTQTYGSIVAAPYGKNIIEKTLNYMGVEKSSAVRIDEKMDFVTVPDLSYKLIGDAGKNLSDIGLKYTTEYVNITDNTVVINQKPAPGELVARGSIVELEVDLNNREEKIVPNLIGKSYEDVKTDLEKLGIKFEIAGSYDDGEVVISETPKISEVIAKDEVLKLEFGVLKDSEESGNMDNSLIDGLINKKDSER